MKKLYVPWRHNYVTKKDKSMLHKHPLKNNCVFCHKFDDNNDEAHLILKRYNHCTVVMNYYPYSAGHVMVIPIEHKPGLEDFDHATRSEMMEAVTRSIVVLRETLHCEGHNVGINLGVAGGGGIPSHLHIHIIPRWAGDTNFLATTAQTTLICTDFQETYKTLHKAFHTNPL
jgi:ATP adenylyltransferase